MIFPMKTVRGLSDCRVMLVDDTEANIDVLVETLGEDHEIAVAMDGETALEYALESSPDLILLDIMMPGMDGYEVIRRLKADPVTRDIPVIFCTALTEVDQKTMGFELGAVDYVTKPFEIPEVKARVQTHLSLKLARDLEIEQKRELEALNEQLEVQKRFIQKIFGRYLSEDIVKSILDTPEGLMLGGEKRTVTILMADLRGFTALSENLPPEGVVAMLNIYLELMTEIIMKYHGTIDEIIGDALLVIFGAPIQKADDPQRAVACAIEMQIAMHEVNKRNRAAGYPDLAMGIGINTGDVVVGNIGSNRRTKYAVVGGNVNLTGRIESYTLGGQILASQTTVDACGPVLRIDGQLEIIPKGVKAPITVYEVGGIDNGYMISIPPRIDKPLLELLRPVAVGFQVLAGKHAGEDEHRGVLVRMSPGAAEICSVVVPEKMENLKISLLDELGGEMISPLYGKVTERFLSSSPSFRVDFTSIPQDVATFTEKVRALSID